MIFRDDIDGRELRIDIDVYKGQKYIVIQGEGYFHLNIAESIARNITQQVERLRLDDKRKANEKEK